MRERDDLRWRGNLRRVGRVRARCAVILGREIADGQVQLKHLDSGDQQTVALEELESLLTAEV